MEKSTLWFKGPIEQDFGVFSCKNGILQTRKYIFKSHADVNSGFPFHCLTLKLRSASVFCAPARTHLWSPCNINIDAYFLQLQNAVIHFQTYVYFIPYADPWERCVSSLESVSAVGVNVSIWSATPPLLVAQHEVWLEVEVTLTEILIPPPASGSAVPEILISILYLKATETAPAYHPAAQRSLHINRDIVIHLK